MASRRSTVFDLAACSGQTTRARRGRPILSSIPALGLVPSGDKPFEPEIARPILAREDKSFMHEQLLFTPRAARALLHALDRGGGGTSG